jgi:hypothetical protein
VPNKTPQKPASSAPIAVNPRKILFGVAAHTEEAQCILENFLSVYFEIVINDEVNLLPTKHSYISLNLSGKLDSFPIRQFRNLAATRIRIQSSRETRLIFEVAESTQVARQLGLFPARSPLP